MDDKRYWPLFELTRSRLLEFGREPEAVFWVFVFPVLVAIGLGIAFRDKPPEAPLVAMTQQAAAVHGGLHETLRTDTTITLRTLSRTEAMQSLRKGKVDAVLDIDDLGNDAGTARAPGTDAGQAFVYHFDPQRSEATLARLLLQNAVQGALGRRDVAPTRIAATTQAGSRYIDFLLPGLVSLNVMGSSMFGIGFAIVLMRKRRLLKRYAATPMRRSHYLLAFMFSRLLFLVAEVSVIFACGVLLFDVVVQGSVAAVVFSAVLGTSCFTGLSLLIAARTDSVEVASGWMNFVQMPMWLLSGTFFSYERFPEVLHPLIRVLPLTALNDLLRALVNDGAALHTQLAPVLIMTCWTVIAFAITLRVFRWQ